MATSCCLEPRGTRWAFSFSTTLPRLLSVSMAHVDANLDTCIWSSRAILEKLVATQFLAAAVALELPGSAQGRDLLQHAARSHSPDLRCQREGVLPGVEHVETFELEIREGHVHGACHGWGCAPLELESKTPAVADHEQIQFDAAVGGPEVALARLGAGGLQPPRRRRCPRAPPRPARAPVPVSLMRRSA